VENDEFRKQNLHNKKIDTKFFLACRSSKVLLTNFSPGPYPETHTKRQAAQHGCLPSLLGKGDI
jgi:hypothetical protein